MAALPASASAERLAAARALLDLHVALAARGWVTGDFYDGCLIYDFARQRIHVFDLDNYRVGAYQNEMGRMFGSTRFMAPEEFELGRTIDERTTVFAMGRTLSIFLSRDFGAIAAVVAKACAADPAKRHRTVAQLAAHFRCATHFAAARTSLRHALRCYDRRMNATLTAPALAAQPVSVTRKMAAALPELRSVAEAKGLMIHHLGAGYPNPEVTDPRGFIAHEQAFFEHLRRRRASTTPPPCRSSCASPTPIRIRWGH